jgi:hypothetical protein
MSPLRGEERDRGTDTMNHTTQEVVYEGRAPTAEEEFYSEWGRAILKGGYEAAKDALRQLMTLDAALIGANIGFLGAKIINPLGSAIAIVCLLASLLVSFWSIIPHEARLCIYAPYEVKEFQQRAMSTRMVYLKVGGLLLAVGLVLDVLAVLHW